MEAWFDFYVRSHLLALGFFTIVAVFYIWCSVVDALNQWETVGKVRNLKKKVKGHIKNLLKRGYSHDS